MTLKAVAASLAICASSTSPAGGFLGVDHRLNYDDSGIWSRTDQNILRYGVIGVEVADAFWEGGDNQIGRTFWQSIDSTALGALSSEGLKIAFSRSRPSQSNDPNAWFQGGGNRSFPSGEVTEVAAAITPFVFEYAPEHPVVYALELLPLYDGIARMKVQAHWQTDVIAGWALGTAAGYLARQRDQPVVFSVLPRGFKNYSIFSDLAVGDTSHPTAGSRPARHGSIPRHLLHLLLVVMPAIIRRSR